MMFRVICDEFISLILKLIHLVATSVRRQSVTEAAYPN